VPGNKTTCPAQYMAPQLISMLNVSYPPFDTTGQLRV